MPKVTLPAQFMEQVLTQFPPDFMSRSESDLQTFGRDWTKVYEPNPSAIVFPRSTQEVALFLTLCHDHGVAVVPSGGRTGLSAGAVAANGEIVLSLGRMNQIGPVDELAHTVHVQAGVITEAVHHHCAPHGLTWPVDFASKGSSQVGGNIATNAGGVKVVRYGSTRNWVLGITAVTMRGEILELNGALEKNNTGPDLRHLLIGSEGTLAVVTEATLKLAPVSGALNVFFFALKDTSAVIALLQECRKAPFTLMAFEYMTLNCLQSVEQVLKLRSPFGLEKTSHPSSATSDQAFVLLEIERPSAADAEERLDQWLASLFERNLVMDGTLAQSPKEGKELWSLRESITESLGHRGLVHKNDVSLPIKNLLSFIHELESIFSHRKHEFEMFIFGHMGDGNLHIGTLKPEKVQKADFLKSCKTVDQELFKLVRKYEGSVSAEHGIGLLKKEALTYTRSPQEIELMRAIKRAFDPKGLLNPGKIFD